MQDSLIAGVESAESKLPVDGFADFLRGRLFLEAGETVRRCKPIVSYPFEGTYHIYYQKPPPSLSDYPPNPDGGVYEAAREYKIDLSGPEGYERWKAPIRSNTLRVVSK